LYLNDKLPTYMIPTLYVSLAMLPRLPNGKINHRNLPEPSWDNKDSGYIAPCTETERTLARLWSEVLYQTNDSKNDISIKDNFFHLGGHSLLANHLISLIRQELRIEVSMKTLFETPILENFAQKIDDFLLNSGNKQLTNNLVLSEDISVIELQVNNNKPKLFCIHPIGGQVTCYSYLAKELATHYSVYGLQANSVMSYSNLMDLASYYCDKISQFQPNGPYRLLGWSSGSFIMLEVQRELQKRGSIVSYAGLLDPRPIPKIPQVKAQLAFFAAINIVVTLRKRSVSNEEINIVYARLISDGWGLETFSNKDKRKNIIKIIATNLGLQCSTSIIQYIDSILDITTYYLSLVSGYRPTYSLGSNVFGYFAAESLELSNEISKQERLKFENLINKDNISIVNGHHYSILQKGDAEKLTEVILKNLRKNEVIDNI
ncbi:thioesterase domain-containing protein, partial [Xenorhabdus sp. SGI246]|uniref:thioesterase domain-containing protein n=1 Tax=Xenorhabdus sp. SGI246 TaxID=3158263 RepID=UPI00349FB0CD